jgi:hypothetical protein
VAEPCAYYVKLGKPHPRYPGGKYSVCITANQHRTLFGDTPAVEPKPLGCGVFACAYPTADPGKVVKITRDETDVAALQSTQGVPGVPQLFAAYKLNSYARWLGRSPTPPSRYDANAYLRPPSRNERPRKPEPFGLVMERLATLDAAGRRRWTRRLECMQRHFSANMDKRTTVLACCPLKPKRDRFACMRAGVQLHETYERIREYGIDVIDIHSGNVGRTARGRWAILDLGLSKGTGYPDVPDLAGARRGRRRRKRR